jgi:poly(A) polymerase
MVGGVVRDMLLGRQPADLDIVTAAPPEAVASQFDRTIPVGAAFGVVTVVLDGHSYQVATFRREGPYADGRRPAYVEYSDAVSDVTRRDFTINALLYDPTSGVVIDHVGGRADLEHRIIRTVGDPRARFEEDRLRLVRAVRLATELEFQIDGDTLAAIVELAPTVVAVSAERLREELVRLLVAPARADGVTLLGTTGMLATVLPEVAALPGERLSHTIRSLELLRRPVAPLAVAALLLGLESGPAVAAVCRRLRFSASEVRAITMLVTDSRRLSGLPSMRRGQAETLLRRTDAAELLELHRVDCLAGGRELTSYYRALDIVAALAGDLAGPPGLLGGDDLIAMGYVPGPQFAEIMRAVGDARARGDITSPDEARAWVRTRYPAGASSRAVEPSGGAAPDPDRGG